MAKIAFLTWQPGLQGDLATSAGGAFWTRYLFDQFAYDEHKVWAALYDEQPEGCQTLAPEEVDIAFVCWRWMLPDVPQYAERNKLYTRQMKLLAKFAELKIPIRIHDEDHKISDEDMKYLKGLDNTRFFMPAINPPKGYEILHFPNPYKTEVPLILKNPKWEDSIVYVGNNYERYKQTKHFLSEPAKLGYNVILYGNWMEEGPGRETPLQVEEDFPHALFPGRLPKDQVVTELSRAGATICLSKPSYSKVGFVTARWYEAAEAQCPMFIPSDFFLGPMALGSLNGIGQGADHWALLGYTRDMINHEIPRLEEVRRLSRFVSRHMKALPWLLLARGER